MPISRASRWKTLQQIYEYDDNLIICYNTFPPRPDLSKYM